MSQPTHLHAARPDLQRFFGCEAHLLSGLWFYVILTVHGLETRKEKKTKKRAKTARWPAPGSGLAICSPCFTASGRAIEHHINNYVSGPKKNSMNMNTMQTLRMCRCRRPGLLGLELPRGKPSGLCKGAPMLFMQPAARKRDLHALPAWTTRQRPAGRQRPQGPSSDRQNRPVSGLQECGFPV